MGVNWDKNIMYLWHRQSNETKLFFSRKFSG